MGKLIRTYEPENQDREHQLAGLRLASFQRRLGAFLIDMILVSVLFMIGVSFFGGLASKLGLLDGSQDYNFQLNFDNWYGVATIAVYFSLSHFVGKGKTVGKKLLKLRVVSLKHEKLGFWHCVERALGLGASALEAGLGYFQVIWKKDRRATHDRIAETIVIDERQ